MNWGETLQKLIFLAKKLQDGFMKSKITQFILVLIEKPWSKIRREKLIMKIEKIIKLYKIKLIDAS